MLELPQEKKEKKKKKKMKKKNRAGCQTHIQEKRVYFYTDRREFFSLAVGRVVFTLTQMGGFYSQDWLKVSA